MDRTTHLAEELKKLASKLSSEGATKLLKAFKDIKQHGNPRSVTAFKHYVLKEHPELKNVFK